jgi:hypothetical protein
VRNTDELGGRDPDYYQRKVEARLCDREEYLIGIAPDGTLNCAA